MAQLKDSIHYITYEREEVPLMFGRADMEFQSQRAQADPSKPGPQGS